MKTLDEAHLGYQRGNGSDKVYHAYIMDNGGTYSVPTQWGRRGGTMQVGSRGTGLTLAAARKAFDEQVGKKLREGYVPIGGAALPTAAVEREDTGFYPQLPVMIDESEVERFLADDRYGMQEKMDGERKTLRITDDAVVAGNKKGQATTISPVIEAAAREWFGDWAPARPDGEAVGDVFYVFDCLENTGRDLSNAPHANRYSFLAGIPTDVGAVRRVPLFTGEDAKRREYERIKAENGEGVVFKLLVAPYRPGEDDAWLKFKFYAEADVIVSAQPTGRHSVAMQLYNAAGELVNVGNVTVPVNKPLPEARRVIRVRYLYAFEGGSLFQTIYLDPRDDKEPEECRLAQLKYKKVEDE